MISDSSDPGYNHLGASPAHSFDAAKDYINKKTAEHR
jgi:hypothetical protein